MNASGKSYAKRDAEILNPDDGDESAAILVLQPFNPTVAIAGEKWIPVGEQNDVRLSIDANSIKKKGNIAWFWLHVLGTQPSQGPQQMLLYASADCRSRTARIRKVVLYNEQGQAMHSVEPGDEGPLTSALPNNDPVIRYVCASR